MWPLVPKVSASDIHALIEVMQEQINSLDCESSFILSEPYSSRKTDRGDEFIGIEENTTQSLSRNPGDLNRKSGNHTSYNGNITSAMH